MSAVTMCNCQLSFLFDQVLNVLKRKYIQHSTFFNLRMKNNSYVKRYKTIVKTRKYQRIENIEEL